MISPVPISFTCRQRKGSGFREFIWLFGSIIALLAASWSCLESSTARGKALLLDEPLSRKIDGGSIHRYTLDVEAGLFFNIEVVQRDIDLIVKLIDPNSKELIFSDSPTGRSGVEQLYWVAGTGGKYSIEVATEENGRGGSYEIILKAMRPPTLSDRERVSAQTVYVRALRALTDHRVHQIEARDLRESAHQLELLLDRSREMGSDQLLANSLFVLARIYFELSELDKAEAYLGEALGVFSELGNSEGIKATLDYLGTLNVRKGNLVRALESYQQAVSISVSSGNRLQQAWFLNRAGAVYLQLQEFDHALTAFDQALALGREAGDSNQEAVALSNLGELYLSLNELQRADDYLQASLMIWDQLKSGSSSRKNRVLNLLGQVNAKRGDIKSAVKYFHLALEGIHRQGNALAEAGTLNELGQVYRALGRHEESFETYAKALEIAENLGDRRSAAEAMLGLGEVAIARSEPRERALEYFQRSLGLYRTTATPFGEAAALYGIARVERAEGNLLEARRSIEECLQIIEDSRTAPSSAALHLGWLSTRQRFYDLLVDVLMEMHSNELASGYDRVAFNVSERGRARALFDLLVEQANGVDPSVANRPSPEWLKDMRSLNLEEIQSEVLDEGTLLLHYRLGDQRSFLWTVSRESFGSFILPPRDEIEAKAVQTYEFLKVSRERVRSARTDILLETLGKLLLGPAERELREAKRLFIVADGAINYIPFSALSLPRAVDTELDSNVPLISRYELVTMPSVSSLAVLRKRSEGRLAPKRKLAVFADPVFQESDPRLPKKDSGAADKVEEAVLGTRLASENLADLERLPWSRLEAERILAQVPAGQGYGAFGFAATRESVLEGQLDDFEIIHFASHGMLNTTNPYRSQVVLSLYDENGRPRWGSLSALEIARLRLRSELVVVSGCETGLGKNFRGEGLVGLPQAFLSGGANRVIVSLWAVDDEATSVLMTSFYRHLFRGMSASAALRLAQLSVRSEPRWSAPFYWAPFVLHGEWR